MEVGSAQATPGRLTPRVQLRAPRSAVPVTDGVFGIRRSCRVVRVARAELRIHRRVRPHRRRTRGALIALAVVTHWLVGLVARATVQRGGGRSRGVGT